MIFSGDDTVASRAINKNTNISVSKTLKNAMWLFKRLDVFDVTITNKFAVI